MTFLLSRRGLWAPLALALSFAVLGSAAAQEEVRLRVHHFLPPTSVTHAGFIEPWARKIEEESEGRIAVEIYPAMQLGGKPPALSDQARDGVVDIVWTLLGYTPGRFHKTEAFELPFMVTTGEATSKAFYEFVQENALDEFQDVKPLVFHTHGAGLLHVSAPGVAKLEDMKGLKLRGPTRIVTGMLADLGATAIGIPVPAVPEALSKGVIDGAVIPWEVTVPLKVPELVSTHTGFSGAHGLYAATMVLVMNKDSYAGLPDDLQAVIDANAGIETAALFGRAMDGGDEVGRKQARDRGNTIRMLDSAETARWKAAAQPTINEWIAEMDGKGHDGKALVEQARALIAKHSK